jgi:site-specific recombinase XerD
MRQLGAPLHIIQQILGHASLKTTMKYLGVEEGEMEEAMQKLRYHPELLNVG